MSRNGVLSSWYFDLTLQVTRFRAEDKHTSKLERQIVCLKISYTLVFSLCLFNVMYLRGNNTACCKLLDRVILIGGFIFTCIILCPDIAPGWERVIYLWMSPLYENGFEASLQIFWEDWLLLICRISVKGKAVPLQTWSGPEGTRNLRFPDYVTTAQDGGKVVSRTHRPPLPSGNASGILIYVRGWVEENISNFV